MRAAGVEPLEPYPGSGAQWKCRCSTCGEVVVPRFNNVVRGNAACRFCSVGHGVRQKDALAAAAAKELEPLEPFPGANVPWRCRCLRCNREVSPRLRVIRNGTFGCVYCGGNKVDENEPAEILASAGLEPLEPYPGSAVPWRCRCLTCGREVSVRHQMLKRRALPEGCWYCSGKLNDPEEAAAVMRAAGLEPLVPYPGTMEPWLCRCVKCGSEITPRHLGVSRGQGGCVWCAGNRVDGESAAELMRAAGLEPVDPYPGSGERWRCTCSRCGREVRPTYSNVRSGHEGCKFCSPGGIDWSGPGWVYLMTHDELGAHKVGITGAFEKRIDQHRDRGWALVASIPTPTVVDAFSVEQTVLAPFRELGVCPYVSAQLMPQGGYTETVGADFIDVPELWRLIEEAASGGEVS